MIDVWFKTGDMAASARFDADKWAIDNWGRLYLTKGMSNEWVAEFNESVWQYVCQIEAEVIPEEKWR